MAGYRQITLSSSVCNKRFYGINFVYLYLLSKYCNPFGVVLYFCFLLVGLSGIVSSNKFSFSKGFKKVLRKCSLSFIFM